MSEHLKSILIITYLSDALINFQLLKGYSYT